MDLPLDLRLALRSLRRRPAFAAVAVATLAIGIGATASMYSIVDAVLLRPLPLPGADRLVGVWQEFPSSRSSPVLRLTANRSGVSYPQYLALRSLPGVTEEATVLRVGLRDFAGAGEPRRVNAGATTASFGATLGVQPVLGRAFREDDEAGSETSVVLLGYDFWRAQFAADPSVTGRTIRLDGKPHTVIGVLPPAARLIARLSNTERSHAGIDLLTLIPRASSQATGNYGHAYNAIVRLAPGVAAARAEAPIAASLAASFETYRRGSLRVPRSRLEPYGQDNTEAVRRPLWLLLAAAGVLLLTACGNVANLAVSEALPRRGEIALRSALGAGRLAVLRPILAESAVLAVAGGALGLALAFGLTRLLVAVAPPGVPNIGQAGLDPRVIGLVLAVVTATALTVGVAPAWLLAGGRVSQSRGGTAWEGSRGGAWLQRALCAAQVALAVVVLTGSFLLLQTLDHLLRVPVGFEARGLLTLQVDLPSWRYPTPESRRTFMEMVRTDVAALPGVRAVTQTSKLPFTASLYFSSNPLEVEGRPAGQAIETDRRFVLPNFFHVMGVPLVAGQPLREPTGDLAPMLVSETTARLVWPDGDALGARVNYGNRRWTVVGIVGDVKDRGLAVEVLPTFYVADTGTANTTLVVRAGVSPASLAPALRSILRARDPELAVGEAVPMEEIIGRTVVGDRYRTLVLGLFAAATLVLAAVGLFGLLASDVRRRARDLAVRVALGAERRRLMGLVLARAGWMAAVGITAGIAMAAWGGRLLQSFLFGVAPTDAWTLAAVSALAAAVTLAAAWVPARRATAIDPARVLRAE